jgi:hypothetical protein
MSRAEVDDRFDYHAPTSERVAIHEAVREASRQLAHTLDAKLPEGREKALALTNLEQSLFWANAAIARAHNDWPS